jgi:TfoX/Sxy family transcriptional regulator of competence genes
VGAMAYDQRTVERVRRILSRRGDVVEKRMVGGLSFNVNGRMRCGVTGADLMVRVGREAIGRFLAQPHVRPMKFAGRPLAGFVLVESEGFRTSAALTAWIRQGIDFASTLPTEPTRSGPALRRSRSTASRRRPRRS